MAVNFIEFERLLADQVAFNRGGHYRISDNGFYFIFAKCTCSIGVYVTSFTICKLTTSSKYRMTANCGYVITGVLVR